MGDAANGEEGIYLRGTFRLGLSVQMKLCSDTLYLAQKMQLISQPCSPFPTKWTNNGGESLGVFFALVNVSKWKNLNSINRDYFFHLVILYVTRLTISECSPDKINAKRQILVHLNAIQVGRCVFLILSIKKGENRCEMSCFFCGLSWFIGSNQAISGTRER